MSRRGTGLLDARPWGARAGEDKLLPLVGRARPVPLLRRRSSLLLVPKDKEIHLHVAAIPNVA
jgi:hypothetical protein